MTFNYSENLDEHDDIPERQYLKFEFLSEDDQFDELLERSDSILLEEIEKDIKLSKKRKRTVNTDNKTTKKRKIDVSDSFTPETILPTEKPKVVGLSIEEIEDFDFSC